MPKRTAKRAPLDRPAGAARQELARWLEQAVLTTHSGVTIADLGGRIVYTNPAEAKMHGYEVGELTGQNVSVLAPPGETRRLSRKDLKTLTAWKRESTNVRKDGSTFPVRLISDVVTNETGEPIGIVTISEDITAELETRRELEQAHAGLEASVEQRTAELSRTNALLRAEQDASPSGILIVDRAGAISSFNQQFLTIWDIPRKMAETKSDEELIQYAQQQLKDPKEFVQRIQYFYSHPEEEGLGDIIHFKSGRVLSRNTRPVRLPTGEIIGRAWSFNDITAYVRSEEAMRASEVKYRSVFENASDAFMILGDEGFTQGNNATLRLFECASREEFLHLHPGRDLSPPKQPNGKPSVEAAEQRIAQAYRDGFCRFEWMHRSLSGREFLAEVTLNRVEVDGRPMLQAVVRDLTEIKRTERLLRGSADAANLLLASRTLAEAIPGVLRALGNAAKVDRVYIFERHPHPKTGEDVASQRYEWCREGIQSEFNNPLLQNLSHEVLQLSDWYRTLLEGKPVGGLTREFSAPLRQMQEAQGVKALLLVPIPAAGDYWGFIGFDDCHEERRWSESEKSMLAAAAASLGGAMAREKAEEALHHRNEFETLVSTLSTHFIDIPSEALSEEIDNALAAVGEFEGVDRSYMFLYSEDGRTMDNTNEWCAEGIEPQMDRLQNMDVNALPWFTEQIRRPDVVHVPEVSALPPEAGPEREEWGAESIQSLVCVPMVAAGRLTGFVGFDSVRAKRVWPEESIALLRLVGEIFANALQRKRFEDTLRAIATDIAPTTGTDFFRLLVETLARTLGVDYAFIGRLLEDGSQMIETIAVWSRNDHAENSRYELAGTPCETVVGQQLRAYGAGLQEQFPQDARLSKMDAQFYMGTPLFDSEGAPSGVLAILHGTPLHNEEELAPILSIFGARAAAELERDTAQQKRLELERKLLETQKLESLGVLAGGIAHDFNNLLMAVMGNASLALMELPPESPARDSVQRIETASRRAAELTQQLLAYSGKGRFVVGPVNLNAVIEEMSHLLRVSISKKAVLRYNLLPELQAVEADATQLRQIVMNLIVNASEALGEKEGIISVTTGNVEADEDYLRGTLVADPLPAGRYMFLEVADTGAGMDAATKQRIFDPFFTTKFTGRGLGLAAVLGIIRGHRGTIQVYSEQDQGTTFKILLPATEKAARPQEGAQVPAATTWRGSGTVLVVDDEESVRTVTADILRKLGFDVILAGDGEAGVALYRASQKKVRCVLLDMTMPHLSGPDVFRELRRIKPDVKVVLMSGYNEQDAISRFAGKGLAGFVQKPFTPLDLAGRLKAILEPAS